MSFLKRNSKSEKDKAIEKDVCKLYFHEDLYCQVELLPQENSFNLKNENERIGDFAQKHFDGAGFTDIYVRKGQEISTSDRKIQLVDFEKLIVDYGFQKCSKVYSGYSTYKELCKNTFGFKLDSSVIYCDFENEIVNNIWIDNFRFSNSSDHKEQLINSLFAIGEKWNLVLNDYDLTETFDK